MPAFERYRGVFSVHYGLSMALSHHAPRDRGEAIPLHVHGDVELNFVLDGELTYLMTGGLRSLSPGPMYAFWAGMPHGLTYVPAGTSYVWVNVPLQTLMSWRLPEPFTARLLGGELLWDHDAPADDQAEDRFMAMRWQREFRSRARAPSGTLLLEIEVRLRRLAASLRHTSASRMPPAHAQGTLERVVQYCGLHFREPLSLSLVAGAVDRSPAHLTSMFKSSCGMGLWEYIVRLRLSYAEFLLATTELTVLDISVESGFGSESQFYETFRRHHDRTPTAYRAETAFASGDRG